MLALASPACRHPVMGDDVYLVPRGGEIAGRRNGRATPASIFTIDRSAIERFDEPRSRSVPRWPAHAVTRRGPAFGPPRRTCSRSSAPIPTDRALIYACGHSKNGILLAPATATAIAALRLGDATPTSISTPFSIDAFRSDSSETRPN